MHIGIKRGLSVLLFIIIGIAALLIGRGLLLHRLKKTLEEKITNMNKSDLNIRFDTLYINWRKNIITAEGLVIEKDAYDTTCVYPEFITAPKVSVEGFNLIAYLINKKINIERITIQDPHIVLRQYSQLLIDSTSKKDNEAALTISAINISNAWLEYTDSASCKLLSEWKTTINSSGVTLAIKPGNPIRYTMEKLSLGKSTVHLSNAFYTFRMRGAVLDRPQQTLTFDTIHIVPDFTKEIFGKKVGHETDRFEGVIPFVKIDGIDLNYIDTFAIKASKANVQMFLKVFRDKQLRNKPRYTRLPIESLRKLPFGLLLDTLQVSKSYVLYEEASKEAPEGITAFFDDLRAHIININNDRTAKEGKTIADAKAALMGQGSVEIHMVMPWQGNANYMTRGAIRDLSMEKFNGILEPLANIKVESGKLEALTFKFQFNNIRSDGEIGLEYKDLKLTSLRDDKEIKEILEKNKWTKKDPKDLKKNPFKSFILNTFIIKRNLDEKDPEEKRTGTILFYRNTSKSVFNYLWKSVFSGIKSAYNLDKLNAKMQARKEKKIKRQKRKKKNT